MAKIKHTKNELKTQREALRRYERFLPMLQLKKQQLQAELQTIDVRREAKLAEESGLRARVRSWVRLFADPVDLASFTKLVEVRRSTNNVAGVFIPVFEGVRFARSAIDLFETPAWIDDGLDAVEQAIGLKAELDVLEEQRRLIATELRITSQRVNLFEKVKIPECREHIRVIKIFLGDQQTAGVARAKIAKGRLAAADEQAAA